MLATSLQLDDLLAPTDAAAFFRDTWEKEPLAVGRADAGYYAGLFSMRDIDDVIAFSRPKFADQAAFRSAAPSPPTYVRGLLADSPPLMPALSPGVAQLRQVFEQGKSLVIMAMQHRWPAIAQLCRNLEAQFRCPVHANMYLTPPGSQGFAAHFDPHEVFVLQLDGVKHWRLYGPAAALPLASDGAAAPGRPSRPAQEIRLDPGDLLYIPRGHLHEAFTSDETSLHLTVGVNVYRWADLLHHALDCISRRDSRFRESIPGGALPGDRDELKQSFRQLLEALARGAAQEALLEEALDSLGDQFFDQLRMLPGGRFAAAATAERIELDTLVERSPQTICRVLVDERGAAIEFPGNRVEAPHRVASALRFVAGATRFPVRALPDDLNAEAKVVLARRLVREGLLNIATSAAPAAFSGAPVTSTEENHANDTFASELAEAMGPACGEGLV